MRTGHLHFEEAVARAINVVFDRGIAQEIHAEELAAILGIGKNAASGYLRAMRRFGIPVRIKRRKAGGTHGEVQPMPGTEVSASGCEPILPSRGGPQGEGPRLRLLAGGLAAAPVPDVRPEIPGIQAGRLDEIQSRRAAASLNPSSGVCVCGAPKIAHRRAGAGGHAPTKCPEYFEAGL